MITREPDDAEGALARALGRNGVHVDLRPSKTKRDERDGGCESCVPAIAAILAALSADGWRVEREGEKHQRDLDDMAATIAEDWNERGDERLRVALRRALRQWQMYADEKRGPGNDAGLDYIDASEDPEDLESVLFHEARAALEEDPMPPTDPTAALRTAGYRFDALLDEMIMAGWEGEFDARERAALNRLGWFQARAEPVQSGPPERRVRVSPPGVANSALAPQADDPSGPWKPLREWKDTDLAAIRQADDPSDRDHTAVLPTVHTPEADDPSGPEWAIESDGDDRHIISGPGDSGTIVLYGDRKYAERLAAALRESPDGESGRPPT